MSKFCQECGAKADGSKFCGECGAAMGGGAAPASTAAATPAAAAAAPAKAGWQPKGADYGMQKMGMVDAIRDSTGKALTQSSTEAQTKRFGGEFTTNRQQTRGITLEQSLQEIDHAIKHGVGGPVTQALYTPAQDAEFGGNTVNGVGSSATLSSNRPNNGFGQPYGAAHTGASGVNPNAPGSKIGGNKANHGFDKSVGDTSGGMAGMSMQQMMSKNKAPKKQVDLYK